MNEKLLQLCSDKIEGLYQRRRRVPETHWHYTQQATKHRDGSVTLEFTVDGLNEIFHWVLSWTGRVKVLAPDELRELYVKMLEDAIKIDAGD